MPSPGGPPPAGLNQNNPNQSGGATQLDDEAFQELLRRIAHPDPATVPAAAEAQP
jgi:hypothetical protein